MIYRVYVSGSHGYEQVGSNIAKKHLIKVLDNIMETITNEKVLVIGHDIEMNCDMPVFLSITDKYEDFRANNCSKKKMLKREIKNGTRNT